MFFNRVNLNKNYSIIIIPERGSSSRTLKLSAGFLKVFLLGLVFVLAFITFMIFYYFFQINNINLLHQKDRYINSLESTNKANLEKIENYNKEITNNNKNGTIINTRLKEIQQLEDNIKKKLDKSLTFKNSSLKNINFKSTSLTNIPVMNETLIKETDNKIENLNTIESKMDTLLLEEQFIPINLPCVGKITSYYGYRKNPFDEHQDDFHPGIDIACAKGTKVFATAAGIVEYASYCNGYGNEIVIKHHNNLQTIYGHNSEICVQVGQAVNRGELIALSGSTGTSTGPHVHYEIRKNKIAIDPKEFLYKGEE